MSGIIEAIRRRQPEHEAWRRDLHAHPETAFEEHRTAAFVAAKLEAFGIEVHRGLGGTGVVGVLRRGEGPAIGLRADMDALPMAEATGLPYASRHAGRMHACGHDGHTTMLLAAARHLAEAGVFAGTAVFIFQPAEEGEGGARAMVQGGLFERFPVDEVYGMHNWPGLAAGRFALRAGPMMAAFDDFDITIIGRGGHAAMPHQGIDPVVVAAHLVTALQSVVARNVHPMDAAVLSITQIAAGGSYNIMPDEAMLRGTARSFRPEVQDLVERRLDELTRGIAAAFGASGALSYRRRYPATVNSEAATARALTAARAVAPEQEVDTAPVPSMGAEDFAFMLREKPGCYVWLGNGTLEQRAGLHSPRYDFNDAVIPAGASYWVRLVEGVLPAA